MQGNRDRIALPQFQVPASGIIALVCFCVAAVVLLYGIMTRCRPAENPLVVQLCESISADNDHLRRQLDACRDAGLARPDR